MTGGRTLAGCRIIPHRGRCLLVVREPAAVSERLAVVPGRLLWWDRRFVIAVKAEGEEAGLSVACLGESGRRAVRDQGWDTAAAGIPAAAQPALPAVWGETGLVAVPHLGYRRPDWTGEVLVRPAPAVPLAACDRSGRGDESQG